MNKPEFALRSLRAGLAGMAAVVALAAQAADEVKPPFPLTDPARVEAGKGRFGATCAAYCHGSGGVGGRAPSFTGRSDFVPAEAFKVISEGRRGTDIMPPWGKTFTQEQIWELVAYLNWLAGQPAAQ
ncbi:c-type cytochrome [Azohydromonas caseinilytica]|uniref:Cytochrome c n=1 Tax=Azohydromonas caseinilytica TaxID=2728836 RepID=A0A848FE56_9BURK|nr:cytochrome c [Azohydromonas caseinilytica]NML16563.1 cytochrome c [Azohydromonas caseinilytica]